MQGRGRVHIHLSLCVPSVLDFVATRFLGFHARVGHVVRRLVHVVAPKRFGLNQLNHCVTILRFGKTYMHPPIVRVKNYFRPYRLFFHAHRTRM